MKHTKRLLAILIAALILAVSAAPALAYTAQTGSSFTFTERLYITEGTTVPNSTYQFAIDNTIGVYRNTTSNVEFGSADTVTVPVVILIVLLLLMI